MPSSQLGALILGASILLSACGGSSGSSEPTPAKTTPPDTTPKDPAPGFQSQRDSILKTSALEAGNCPNGGVQIEMGIDTNGNGVLDTAEIDNSRTQMICHGRNGDNTPATLFDIAEPSNEECEHGGKKVSVGQDINADGTLNENEVVRTELLCNAIVTVEQPASLIRTKNEPAGNNCANGGIKILAGLDNNSNLSLDNDEVQSTSYVCSGIDGHNGTNGTDGVDGVDGTNGTNGTDGVDGTNGTDGKDGNNGHTSLIKTLPEPAGENCSNGGTKVVSGIDNNLNQQLDDNEISATSYVCNGQNGTNGSDGVDGVDGVDGTNGTNGTDGVDGNNGHTSLIKTLPEPAGENCSNGGTKVVSGIDNNQNQQLDDNEISATSYVCNGQNGTNGTNGEDGIDGQDSDGALAGKLLINTEQEPFGSNCLHGGHKHSIGLDNNSDNVLQDNEITSRSYSCNDNSAPTITFSDNLRAVPGYEFNLFVTSEDFSQYGQDPVQISVTDKPEWLTVANQGNNILRLSGIAAGNPGDTFTVTVQSTDTELTSIQSVEVSLVEGVYISIEANDIVEGNQDESNPYGRTESSFKLKLSSALEDDLRILGNLFNIYTSSHLWVKPGDYYGNIFFESTFAAGETEKTIEIALNADNQYELAEGFIIVLNNVNYEGDKEVLHPAFAEVNIINDDPELLAFQSDQSNSIQVAFARLINNESSTELVNAPEWLTFNQQYGHECDYNPYHQCYDTIRYRFQGNPPASAVGETYTFTAKINLRERVVEEEVTLTVVEGDTDSDGVLNSADAFPDDHRYQSDEDNDGLADKWELNYFGDLTTTDGSGDADGDEISDADEFTNQTPPAPDSDHDGVADAVDAYPNDSRYQRDSDNDGMADRWELQYFGSIETNNASTDHDNDGLNDADEFVHNTNPTQTDSDYDGVIDGDDPAPKNSDYRTDSDNDGLPDEWEVEFFGNTQIATADTDSDDDGITDLEEFRAGTLAAIDSDSDGTPDISDAFPNNAEYQADSDNDGIADKWEREHWNYNLHIFNAPGDFDQDGISDLEEFQNQTSPVTFDGELVFLTDSSSNIRFYSSDNSFNYEIQVGTESIPQWLSHENNPNHCMYEYCQTLTLSAAPTAENESETGSFSISIDGLPPITVNYRVAVDSDGDQIADEDDAFPNNASYSKDSDNDGIADKWEQNQFSSLDIVDENSDYDRDGFNDLNEFLAGSNPKYADTDNDGLSDGADAFPTKRHYKTDSDNDGLADEWELTYFASLEEANAETDSDSDGISDIDEFKAGTLAAIDSDSDGTADISDAFPNNALYTTDSDNDGIADKWERNKSGGYSSLSYFSETSDYDLDGFTDKEEFINGTEPTFFDGELVFKSGENNNRIYYQSPREYRGAGFTGDVPDWLGHNCPTASCRSISLTGTPTEEEVGETGSFDIILSSTVRTVTYRVEEGDTDGDGVLNSADAFPTIASAHTDSDDDGLGDEWEMANFESLELANGTTDFDNNGVTDLQAFENGTPINDLTFDFESGELPNGWVNSGDINWVVTDEHSYQGDYALTIEQPLAPGEEATINFTVRTQPGTLKIYTKIIDIESQAATIGMYLQSNDSILEYLSGYSYWSTRSTNLGAGVYSLQLRYENLSPTNSAPKIYVDSIQGLIGWIPADRDGDGVLNSVDLYPDRSDAATDSDNDGIGDEWEMRYFGTLDRVDNTTDYDGDGLLDGEEFTAGTSLTDTDSDNDGYSDGNDAFPTQYRYQADTDNDGLADKWELAHFGSLETSDGSQDSDSDGASDLAEFEAQTPPMPDRDNDGTADVVDAFPDNPEYKLDSDNDGIADEWESQYGYTSRYSDTSDYDGDGRNDLTEFLEGTNPNEKNLNAAEDIFALAQGKPSLWILPPTIFLRKTTSLLYPSLLRLLAQVQ